MGIDVDRKKYEPKLSPIQKFRAGVYCVIAATRISNLEEQWRGARKIGDELKLARRRREDGKKPFGGDLMMNEI